MVRYFLMASAVCAVAACQPAIPNSGADVTLASTLDAQQQRDAQLAQPVTQPSLSAPSTVESGALPPAAASDPLPASVTAAVNTDPAQAAANSGVAPVQASPANPAPTQAPAPTENAGISTEQDFDTVSSQRSIESDAQRIANNRAQYVVVSPTDLPKRPGSNQPNIVEYALRTNNPVGTQIYRRSNFRSAQRHASVCARYPSADQAQIEFLSRGGPTRDRSGLDPDGDGYACTWDPSPFRGARASVSVPETENGTAPAASSVVEPLAISSE